MDDYKQGYDAGYKSGVAEGKNAGYKHGHERGHRQAYKNLNVAFLRRNTLPVIGLAVLLLMSGGMLYWSYCLAKAPAQRLIEHLSARAEEKRQRGLIVKELQRKREACHEQAESRAWQVMIAVSAQAHELLGDARVDTALEDVNQETANQIYSILVQQTQDMINHYERAAEQIRSTKHLNSRERATLYAELSQLVNGVLARGGG